MGRGLHRSHSPHHLFAMGGMFSHQQEALQFLEDGLQLTMDLGTCTTRSMHGAACAGQVSRIWGGWWGEVFLLQGA